MKVKLEEVCERGSSNLKQSDIVHKSGQYPIYGASGCIDHVDFYHQEKKYVAVVKDGAGIGRTMLLPAKSSIIGTMQYLLPKKNVLPEYLYYVVRHMHLEKYFSGATIPHIYFRDYKNEEFNLDCLEKQTDIVETLGKVEKIIASRQQQLQKLDELVKARFVEMFGDPINNDKNWEMITLLESLEHGRSVSYGIVQTGDDYENGVPVFRPVDIAGNHTPKREELKKTDPSISSQYKRTILKGNELLITVRGSVGETFQTTPEFEGCNVGRNIVPLVTNEKIISQRFLQELFDQDAIKRWLKGITKGIALQGLNMGEFKKMPVIKPPIELQISFVSIAKQLDKSKFVVQQALEKAQLLFDSLMQQYFG